MIDSPRTFDPALAARSVLAVNSGSSTIKFGLFTFEARPRLLCRGTANPSSSEPAVSEVMRHIDADVAKYPLAGVGHRIVHGGPSLFQPQRVTPELVSSLREVVRFAPNHLPAEIDLIESIERL